VRDEALLESALTKPQHLFACGHPPPDLAALAASLAFGLARNHPFVDGNKRTARVACRVFLAMNDAELEAGGEKKCLHILSLAEGSLIEAEFADWLRPRVRVQPKHQVNEGKARDRR
jgi:death-on-curing protein